MRVRNLIIAMFVAAFAITALCVAGAVTVANHMELAQFHVFDKREGSVVSFPVPIGIIRAVANSGITIHCSDRDVRDLRQLQQVMNEASTSLSTAPDMTILDVQNDREHVTLRKEGENLRLHVDSDDAEVSITIPHRALRTNARIVGGAEM